MLAGSKAAVYGARNDMLHTSCMLYSAIGHGRVRRSAMGWPLDNSSQDGPCSLVSVELSDKCDDVHVQGAVREADCKGMQLKVCNS